MQIDLLCSRPRLFNTQRSYGDRILSVKLLNMLHYASLLDLVKLSSFELSGLLYGLRFCLSIFGVNSRIDELHRLAVPFSNPSSVHVESVAFCVVRCQGAFHFDIAVRRSLSIIKD